MSSVRNLILSLMLYGGPVTIASVVRRSTGADRTTDIARSTRTDFLAIAASPTEQPSASRPYLVSLIGTESNTVREARKDKELEPGPPGHLLPKNYDDRVQPYQSIVDFVTKTHLLFIAVQALGATCFAYFYMKNKPKVSLEVGSDVGKFNTWSSLHMDCFSDVKSCMVGFFCPCTLWAATTSTAGVISNFWKAFCIFLGLWCCNTFGAGLVYPILVLVLVWSRNEMRKRFDMIHGTFGSVVEDCFCYCFFMPCTICQEARHIDAVTARQGECSASRL